MVFKVVGCCLAFLGCSSIGICKVMKNAIRIRILQELEQILQYIYGEIEYAAVDMAEIMEGLSGREGYFSHFFQNVRERILAHQGMRLRDYWKEEMGEIQGIETLHHAERELLVQIGENLGNLDRMTQLRILGLFQKRISEMLVKAEQEQEQKAKLSMIIWATGGIFLVILLI